MEESTILLTSRYIFIEGLDQIRFAGDGHQSVSHMLTLEEGLQDLDGADGVDVDVGDDQDPIIGAEQVEKFFPDIWDEHFSDKKVTIFKKLMIFNTK